MYRLVFTDHTTSKRFTDSTHKSKHEAMKRADVYFAITSKSLDCRRPLYIEEADEYKEIQYEVFANGKVISTCWIQS